MAEMIFYPDAGTGSTTVDGMVKRHNVDETWGNIRTNAGTDHNDTSASPAIYFSSTTTNNQWGQLRRFIMLFDTSEIPDDVTVTGVTVSIWGTGKNDVLGSAPTLNIYKSTPASDNDLVNGDYNQIETTDLAADITYAAFNTSDYNVFTLTDVDADDFGYIKKLSGVNGITKLAMQESTYDATNTPPSWTSEAASSFSFRSADQGGTTNDPKLIVTYTLPAVAVGGSPLAALIEAGLI